LREDLGNEVANSVKSEIKNINKKDILVLSIKRSDKAVYVQRKKFYVRQGAESVLLEGEEMEKRLKNFKKI
jgi:hypothetical protein